MEYTEDDSETQIADGHDEEDWMYTHSNRGNEEHIISWSKLLLATKTMEEIAQTIMTEEEEEAEIKRGLEKLELDKIPDLDDIPNMDDIPDMDDQVEEEDDPVSA
jgi:ubiquitin-like-conjugating enzyme ATG3